MIVVVTRLRSLALSESLSPFHIAFRLLQYCSFASFTCLIRLYFSFRLIALRLSCYVVGVTFYSSLKQHAAFYFNALFLLPFWFFFSCSASFDFNSKRKRETEYPEWMVRVSFAIVFKKKKNFFAFRICIISTLREKSGIDLFRAIHIEKSVYGRFHVDRSNIH